MQHFVRTTGFVRTRGEDMGAGSQLPARRAAMKGRGRRAPVARVLGRQLGASLVTGAVLDLPSVNGWGNVGGNWAQSVSTRRGDVRGLDPHDRQGQPDDRARQQPAGGDAAGQRGRGPDLGVLEYRRERPGMDVGGHHAGHRRAVASHRGRVRRWRAHLLQGRGGHRGPVVGRGAAAGGRGPCSWARGSARRPASSARCMTCGSGRWPAPRGRSPRGAGRRCRWPSPA